MKSLISGRLYKGHVPAYFMTPELIQQNWKEITPDIVPDIYDYYIASDQGLVYNIYREMFMTQTPNTHGYLCVKLSRTTGKPITFPVHIIVAKLFIYNPNPLLYNQVNHMSAIKSENAYTNLEWVTGSENMIHAGKMGLIDPHKLKRNGEEYKICEYFEMHNNEEYSTDLMRSALEYAGVMITPNSITNAKNIYNHKTHKNVSENYNF